MTVFPDIITVEVTKEDILSGLPCESRKCAFALAVERLFPGCYVTVADDTAAFDGDGGARYKHTGDLENFISLFDSCGDSQRARMEPRTFELIKKGEWE